MKPNFRGFTYNRGKAKLIPAAKFYGIHLHRLLAGLHRLWEGLADGGRLWISKRLAHYHVFNFTVCRINLALTSVQAVQCLALFRE
jgi:hypothetical protein